MNTPKNIAVLSGKRGGYGAMKHLLRCIEADTSTELQLILTDQHLDARFGNTIDEVARSFKITGTAALNQVDGSATERAKALGRCTSLMADLLHDLGPDILVLYGDRGEVLATALAATTLNIPIAHIQGGDVTGSLDENMRHAITKLSHLHFPSTLESAQRILGLGEESWRVHIVGDSHLDCIAAGEFLDENEMRKSVGLTAKQQFAVVLQHPDATQPDWANEEMRLTLQAVLETDLELIVVYPCSDPGYEGIIAAINEFQWNPRIHVFKNLEAEVFWSLLAHAKFLIGNSSAGIIESPSFRLPVVNVGNRQLGRLAAENVIHSRSSLPELRAAISRARFDESFAATVSRCSQPYGDGSTGQRIFSIIKRYSSRQELLSKRMTY